MAGRSTFPGPACSGNCRLIGLRREANEQGDFPARSSPLWAWAGAAGALALAACFPDLLSDNVTITPPPPPKACGDGFIALDGDDSGAPPEECDPGSDAGSDNRGCTDACKVSCPEGGKISNTHHCYFEVKHVANADDATNECRRSGAHVVTLSGPEERQFLENNFKMSRYLLGLARAGTNAFKAATRLALNEVEPGWAPDCTGCYATLPPGEKVFAKSPKLDGGFGFCVSTSPGGPYEEFDCDTHDVTVICEREPLGRMSAIASGGFSIRIPSSSKRYFFAPNPSIPDDAIALCRSLGGSLVTFDSASEREEVVVALQQSLDPTAASEFVWMGLARTDDSDGGAGFVWERDAGLDAMAAWGIGEPSAAPGPARAAAKVLSTQVDVQLAAAYPPSAQWGYVCQY